MTTSTEDGLAILPGEVVTGEKVYILGESTIEQTIVNGKPSFERPDFTRPIAEGLALNGYRMVLDESKDED